MTFVSGIIMSLWMVRPIMNNEGFANTYSQKFADVINILREEDGLAKKARLNT